MSTDLGTNNEVVVRTYLNELNLIIIDLVYSSSPILILDNSRF